MSKKALKKSQSKRTQMMRQLNSKKAHKKTFTVYNIKVEVNFVYDWKSHNVFIMFDDKDLIAKTKTLKMAARAEQALDNAIINYADLKNLKLVS